MWRPSASLRIAFVLGITLVFGTPFRLAAQAGAPAAPVAPADQAPTRLSGMWRLNTALSSPTPPEPPIGQGAPGQGGPPGGGRGGQGGRGGREVRGNSTSADKLVQVRAVMRELTPPATTLAIVATASGVAFTSDDGVVRRFVADGQKLKVDLGGAKVDATTRWEANGLVQQLAPPGLKVARAWRVTDQGNQMVLSIAIEGGPDRQAAPLTFIYDREK